tara:strand:+ start:260 stop:1033 length:774 start_codon:yes stop_codon:yes gene_type:complete
MHSSIIFTKDTLLMFQENFKELLHYHETIQVIIAYESPFQIRFDGGEWQEYYGIIIEEDQNFEVETGLGIDAILTIIPDTKKAQKLMATVLDGRSFYSFNPQDYKEVIDELITFNGDKNEGINHTLDLLINQITKDFSENEPMSEKVERAIHYIENNMSHDISTEKIADIALSTPGHLNFLFRQQTGVSMSRFVEWTSLASVIISTVKGTDLKKSVKEAGFMSFSDFSHTFTKIFGITPRQLLADENYKKALTAFSD